MKWLLSDGTMNTPSKMIVCDNIDELPGLAQALADELGVRPEDILIQNISDPS